MQDDKISINENEFYADDACDIYNWIHNIKIKALNNVNTKTNSENYHYCPDFSKDLERFLRTVPLWSAVLIKKYNYGK